MSGYSSLPHLALAVTLSGLPACTPELNVGEWVCAQSTDAGLVSNPDLPLELPWSTGFEDGFCDYARPGGFCYGDPLASYTTVTSPVHSGRHAAAFSVNTDQARARQARCVRQGMLPTAAYYTAWYLVPEPVTNGGLWNLLHFQGGSTSSLHGLWDVSLVTGRSGELELVVFDFLNGMTRRPATSTPIPIGAWFQIEFYLARAAAATGEIALYQDGQLLVRAENIITDDSSFGQWYVGNLANSLMPSESTLYVDDVSVRTSR